MLFVDDEKNVLKSIKRGLYDAGFRIYTASSAAEGLQILRQVEDIDIVVTDYRMPEMDGIEFLKRVRNEHQSISRIILSGYVDQTAVLNSLSTGLAGTFFAKPWNDDVLNKRLKQKREKIQK